MTPDITQFFEGKEIRAIEHKQELWVPVADISKAWGMDRTTPSKIILRNQEVFKDLVMSHNGGDVMSHDEEMFLNERGLYLLMGKISVGRLKNPQAKEAIIRFQRWFPQLLQQFRKGMANLQTLAESERDRYIKEQLDTSDLLIARLGLNKDVAHKYAFEFIKSKYPDLHPYGALIPAGVDETTIPQLPAAQSSYDLQSHEIPSDPDFDAMYSLRKLAESCKVSENQARNILEDAKIIYHSPAGIWVVQDAKYGKMFDMAVCLPGTTKRKQFARYTPAARDLVLDKLKEEQVTLGEGKA